MKTHSRTQILTKLVAALTLALLCKEASAVVNSSTQITFGGSGTDYGASILQTAGTDYTEALFNYTGTTFRVSTEDADEGSDWYLANFGDTFAQNTIAANQFLVIFKDINQPPFFISNTISLPLGNFYLGVNTGISYDPATGFPVSGTSRDVFGWLELDNTGAQLLPVDNAVAYAEQGIVIGTTTPVPEPPSAALLLLALTLLPKRRARSANS